MTSVREADLEGVLTWKVSLPGRCPYLEGVLTWKVSLPGRCPYLEGVLTWKVSLPGRCPYLEGVLDAQDERDVLLSQRRHPGRADKLPISNQSRDGGLAKDGAEAR